MRLTATALSLVLLPVITFAQTGETVIEQPAEETPTIIPEGTATITMEQVGLDGIVGSWILSLPDHTQRTSNATSTTLSDIPSGNYIVYATLPNGMRSTIRIYKNGTLDRFFERQQTPFSVWPGDNVRIAIHYSLDKTGTISVQSDPSGTAFTLNGPDGLMHQGITPQSYVDLPEGQYKVQYEPFAEGCGKPAPKAGQLVDDGRVSFDIRFDCPAATTTRERQAANTKKYLTIVVDGKDVPLQDVQQSDWFATYVFEAAKRNILSGYRDDAGNPTGTFGPGNNVTVAELAKIAHRMAGLSEEPFAAIEPRNASGAHQWFSPFLASSESRSWIIYADARIDPLRPATRGEVIVTLLQAFDIPLRWQKGSAFTDVPVSHPYAAAIETAAGDEIVAGRTDAEGNALGLFDPDAPITRAETAKIITTILQTYASPTTLRNAAERKN